MAKETKRVFEITEAGMTCNGKPVDTHESIIGTLYGYTVDSKMLTEYNTEIVTQNDVCDFEEGFGELFDDATGLKMIEILNKMPPKLDELEVIIRQKILENEPEMDLDNWIVDELLVFEALYNVLTNKEKDRVMKDDVFWVMIAFDLAVQNIVFPENAE